jgi:hypothetical protein
MTNWADDLSEDYHVAALRLTDAFAAALMSPLCDILPIAAPQHERSADEDLLNRHAVLHGASLNYGNKADSLRAISLVNYVAQVL